MIEVGEKRSVEFNKELRYKRQQDYNIMNYALTDHDFKCGHKKVYKNLNFSIFVDDYCNADCKFCVAQIRYDHKSRMYEKNHISDPDKYLARLEDILKVVRPVNPSVSITGGEPSLSPILPDILRLVDKYDFRKRTITTNGSGLLLTRDNDTVLGHLIKNNFQHINISRTHFDDEVNLNIMRFNNKDTYCTVPMLKEILNITSKTDLKHRLSCLLLKEGIHTVEDIKKYLDFYGNIGANNFIFRELMDYDHNAVNREKMDYCDSNRIKLQDIWEEMEKHKEFKPYLNLVGYYYYVEIYKYKNMTVASEAANLNQQYIEKAKHQDVVYEMIFHNNGNLCGSWIDDEEVLDGYK